MCKINDIIYLNFKVKNMELIIASNNKNKIREIKEILGDLDINFKSLNDINFNQEIEENGETFEANAYIKAKTIFDYCHLPVIADDSGLCCEALNGEPGVYSHRYAGLECDDHKNNLKLIENIKDKKNKNAKYVCAICFINQSGDESIVLGSCEGKIILTPRGNNGFGYDPYFYLESENKTMAELTSFEKNSISHRKKALLKIEAIIRENINN